MGPTLFNLSIYDIPTPVNCSCALYADDTAVITQNHDIQVAAESLQLAVSELSEWFHQWNINLNYNKCHIKIFTLRRYTDQQPIVIDAHQIPWTPKDRAVKYLGLHFDTRLTWGSHVNQKLNEAYARLAMLYPIINRRSPLKIECSKIIYQGILRPLIMYACVIWGTTSKTNRRKIQVLQNKCLRIATDAEWYVRNEQLHR